MEGSQICLIYKSELCKVGFVAVVALLLCCNSFFGGGFIIWYRFQRMGTAFGHIFLCGEFKPELSTE